MPHRIICSTVICKYCEKASSDQVRLYTMYIPYENRNQERCEVVELLNFTTHFNKCHRNPSCLRRKTSKKK